MSLHHIFANSPFIASRTAPALVIFILINGFLNILLDRKDLFYTGIMLPQNLIVYSFISHPVTQQRVVLMGSSIMDTPFGRYNKILDYYYYVARSSTTEEHLKSDTKENIGVANLCLEGAMISDQYILLKKYVSTRSPVPIIVLGITPRDFIDPLFRKPEETTTFRSLVNITDIYIWPYYIKKPEQFLEFALNQFSLAYRYRTALLCRLKQQINNQFIGSPDQNHNRPVKNQVNNPSHNRELRFAESMKDYAKIYSDKDKGPSYCCQMNFLKQLLKLCHHSQIPMLLMNMPLTQSNRDAMEPGFYQRFKEMVAGLANENKIIFLDASDSSVFKDDQDYWDCAHLNDVGGEKLNKLMCPLIERLLQIQEQTHKTSKTNRLWDMPR